MIKNTHQIFRNYSAEKMGNSRLPNFSLKKWCLYIWEKVAIFLYLFLCMCKYTNNFLICKMHTLFEYHFYKIIIKKIAISAIEIPCQIIFLFLIFFVSSFWSSYLASNEVLVSSMSKSLSRIISSFRELVFNK